MTVGAVVNALALIIFAMRRRPWSELALAASQVGNILFSLVASLAVSPAWLLLGAAPALTNLILMVVLQTHGDARLWAGGYEPSEPTGTPLATAGTKLAAVTRSELSALHLHADGQPCVGVDCGGRCLWPAGRPSGAWCISNTLDLPGSRHLAWPHSGHGTLAP